MKPAFLVTYLHFIPKLSMNARVSGAISPHTSSSASPSRNSPKRPMAAPTFGLDLTGAHTYGR